MNLHDNCACCGMSRRDFLKLSALFTSSFGAAIAADNWNLPVHANANDQPVKIGYLPITDANDSSHNMFLEVLVSCLAGPEEFILWPWISRPQSEFLS